MVQRFFISISVLVLIMGVASCGSNDNKENVVNDDNKSHHEKVVYLSQKQIDALGIKMGHLQKRNLTTILKTNGKLRVFPDAIASVTAIMGGNVKSIKVFYGNNVVKGQVLAVLQHPDYIALQEEFLQLSGKLDYLKQEYERQKKLYENNVAAGKDFQKAKADYFSAKSRFEGLKIRLKMLGLSTDEILKGNISESIPIVSPINGYVTGIYVKVGQYVNADTKLFDIANNKKVYADLLVYEKEAPYVNVGQKVHMYVTNKKNIELSGEVFSISKKFDNDVRAIHVFADISNVCSDLIPGMYITGHIHIDSLYTEALPADAIVSDGTKSYVFVFNKSMKEKNKDKYPFKVVEVITGVKDNGFVEIKSVGDISPDDSIVLNNAYYLYSELHKEEFEDED